MTVRRRKIFRWVSLRRGNNYVVCPQPAVGGCGPALGPRSSRENRFGQYSSLYGLWLDLVELLTVGEVNALRDGHVRPGERTFPAITAAPSLQTPVIGRYNGEGPVHLLRLELRQRLRLGRDAPPIRLETLRAAATMSPSMRKIYSNLTSAVKAGKGSSVPQAQAPSYSSASNGGEGQCDALLGSTSIRWTGVSRGGLLSSLWRSFPRCSGRFLLRAQESSSGVSTQVGDVTHYDDAAEIREGEVTHLFPRVVPGSIKQSTYESVHELGGLEHVWALAGGVQRA